MFYLQPLRCLRCGGQACHLCLHAYACVHAHAFSLEPWGAGQGGMGRLPALSPAFPHPSSQSAALQVVC